MRTKDMTCPKCGAVMKVDSTRENAICEYCGYHVIMTRTDIPYKMNTMQNNTNSAYEKKRKIVIIATLIIAVIAFSNLFIQASVIRQTPKINPFDYIEVSFQGNDGKGEVIVETIAGEDGINPNEITYRFSQKSDLFEGNSITIYAESDTYRLSEESRLYKVEGLDEYLSDLESIPQEALELVHKKAKKVLDTNLENCKNTGLFKDMKPVKLFLLTDEKQENRLYDVFEAHFTVNEEEQIYYVVAIFDDVVVRDGKQVSLDMTYGVYGGHLTQVHSWLWIMAYESVEEVQTDILTSQKKQMELKELDL